MNTAQKDEATPNNEKGKFVDEEESVIENSEEEAIVTFNRACARLLNPPVWQQLTSGINASFAISLPGQEKVERLLQQGDYVSVDIPGPGSAAGEGYDWVKVETIEEALSDVEDRDNNIYRVYFNTASIDDEVRKAGFNDKNR